MLLDLPDRRQSADYDCGAAAVAAACLFLGRRPPARLANPVQGMAPDTVEAALRLAGLPVLSGTMTVDDLRHLTRAGRPVLCPVSLHGGHWVAVRGVERGRVHFHCPLDGRLALPAAEWVAAWRDTSRAGHEFDRFGIAAG